MVEMTESDRPRSLKVWLPIAILSKLVTVQQKEVWNLETEGPLALATARVPPLLSARKRRTKDANVNLE